MASSDLGSQANMSGNSSSTAFVLSGSVAAHNQRKWSTLKDGSHIICTCSASSGISSLRERGPALIKPVKAVFRKQSSFRASDFFRNRIASSRQQWSLEYAPNHSGQPVTIKAIAEGVRKSSQNGAATRESSSTGSGQTAATPTELWTPDSWRAKPIKQHPRYPDEEDLRAVENKLSSSPPLVFVGEVKRMMNQLGKACQGKAFLLQGGDCAESFSEFHPDHIRDTFQLLIQMSMVLMYGLQVPIVKVGRMAGQFAKPRSADMEKIGDIELPSYRGDMINGPEFTAEARVPNPSRMVQCYQQSTATLNMLRALAQGGYVDLRRVHEFSLEFTRSSDQAKRYADIAERIEGALAFMEACGVSSDNAEFRQAEFFSSHEALLLPYEESLTRLDKQTGQYYATSGHMLWVGDRTRQIDCAHIEFLRGIANPIGIKAGPSLPPDDLIRLLDILNPQNIPGRITVIARNGANLVRDKLPPLVQAVKREGRNVVWSCDPMHGNTTSVNGFKTRRFDAILDEVRGFFEVHEAEGTYPGGVHFEMTGTDVTECTGGASDVTDQTLKDRYTTACDPRLNASQALELAFLISEQARGRCDLSWTRS